MFRGKKYQESAKQIDKNALYDTNEAMELLVKTAPAKFDETVELHVKLGVDSRHADQQVRGAIVLPHGTGKTTRVLVFCKEEQVQEALDAGADYAGGQDLVAKIQGENWFEFDTVIASPNMMGVVGRLGKVLGPKGLMPSPKAGTVTPNIANAIKGKLLQEEAKKVLVDNITACDEVWTVSHGAGENLKSLGYQGDCVVMENGVDLKKGLASPELVAELRQKHALPADVPVFLFVGRLMWYKGARIILDGLKMIANDGKDFRMVFVGDSVERPEIEQYAKTLGIQEKCIFVGAVHNREIIRGYFTLSDLFLFPSSFDTNGIVVREAAACGKASVLLRESCASEGIEDGKTGLLIEETGESMAKCLSFACENREKLKVLGQTAMDEIYISWEDAVEKATKRYELVVENFKSRETAREKVRFDEMFRTFSEINVAMQRVEDTSRFLFQKLVKKGKE